MYIPLGVKTDYTLLSSLIKISDLINFALENKIEALGILDNNLCGVMDFYDNCIKNNIIISFNKNVESTPLEKATATLTRDFRYTFKFSYFSCS